jgi:flagellar protein FliO/FliZ
LTVNDGLSAVSLLGAVQIRKTATGVALVISGDAANSTGKEVATDIATIAVNDESTGEALTTSLVAGGAVPAADAALKVTPAEEQVKIAEINKLPESEIPVLTKTKLTKKEASGGLNRLMITLGVLSVVLGAAAFGVKRYTNKVGKNTPHASIKIITQHHIGPKKSLAIVQVAGESILIGISDQNISMLKSLSLIDDEVPEELPARFEHALEAPQPRRGLLGGKKQPQIQSAQFEEDDSEDFAMQGLSEIRDVVNTRLKNMRNI